jgi:hypothetical protein
VPEGRVKIRIRFFVSSSRASPGVDRIQMGNPGSAKKGKDVPERTLSPTGAGSTYCVATDMSFVDVTNGLSYVLLRLGVLGLSEDDREQLRELARLAFSDRDVIDAVMNIKSNSRSPLAIAMADILQHAGGRSDKKIVMLGAVFGAYAALGGSPSRQESEGVLGAIAGAVAVSTSKTLIDFMQQQNEDLMNFVQKK